MKSAKTHMNKAHILIGIYSWMETFEENIQWSAKIAACRQHLRSFANNAKHKSRYQLPPNFDEKSMVDKGSFFTPKEYLVYVQWAITRFNKLVDEIIEAKE